MSEQLAIYIYLLQEMVTLILSKDYTKKHNTALLWVMFRGTSCLDESSNLHFSRAP